MSSLSRRRLLIGAASAAAGSLAFSAGYRAWHIQRQPRARVTTLSAPTYDPERLVDLLVRSIREYEGVVARAKGGRVVLKPNLVEWSQERPVNTDPRFVVAVAEAFRKLGAREVIIAEGPGHRRDTELLLEQSGLGELLGHERLSYVDLNVDVPKPVALRHNLNGLGVMQLPVTVTSADLFVSLPKLKTHHWAGVTLSMKNLFGTVPGSVYGWPKNPLHVAGIDQSIVDLWSTLQPGFAIVDGIVAMEGDGPLKGEAVDMGVVVLGDQLPAVDATCARLMELNPDRMPFLLASARLGGTTHPSRIEVVGDVHASRRFRLVPKLEAHFRG